MARYTPTHEPPDFPDEELLPEEPAPSGRQLLRMFLPVAAVIVIFITALMLVLKFLVIPAMERSDPAVQTRALATIGALQTQQAVTRTQQALTPQATPQPASTPRPVATAQPAARPTAEATSPPIAVPAVKPAAQATAAPTSAAGPITKSAVPAPTQPNTTPSADIAATPALAVAETVSLESCPALPSPISVNLFQELLQAHQLYWSRRTLALRDLDLAPMEEVATGTELSGTAQLIDELRAEGRAIRTSVTHHICVLSATSEQAQIADAFEDRSIYIDAVTKEPLQPPKPDSEKPPVVQEIKVFQKEDGAWKVIGGLRP